LRRILFRSRLLRWAVNLDADDIIAETAAELVSRRNEPGEAVLSEGLSIFRIGNHDLVAAKRRAEPARAKNRFIAAAARHDHDLAQNTVPSRPGSLCISNISLVMSTWPLLFRARLRRRKSALKEAFHENFAVNGGLGKTGA